MRRIVNVHEAKTHLSRLQERVQVGEEVALAKAGKPCAQLVLLREDGQGRRSGRFQGRHGEDFFGPQPEEALRAWESGA